MVSFIVPSFAAQALGGDVALRRKSVIPAKAGIHWSEKWTPAIAGVTTFVIFIPLGG